jgi:hypothetical protein
MIVLAWRLGLGWLIGRKLLLLTTTERRLALPYRMFAGTFYLERTAAPWATDLDRSPFAMVQAWPGPRSVRARRIDDSDEQELAAALWGDDRPLIALDPTGHRTPEITPPDLIWVWPLAVAAWLLWRRRGSRRR